MSDLPQGWIYAPLLEITELHDSRRIPLNATERATRKGSYPYYGANGQVDTIDDYIFDGNYTLLAEDGGYFDDPSRGVAYEVSGKFWVNNHAHILSTLGQIPLRFLTHALNDVNWMPHVGGSTRLKLTQQGMQQVQLPLPPLSEQRRTIAKLDSLMARSKAARDELARIPLLIEHYKQAILSKAFAPEVLQQWAPGTVEHLLTEGLIGLVRSKSEQNSSSSGIPYIRMNHFDMWGNWNENNLTYIAAPENEFRRFELKEGDVLFNTRNSVELVGKVAIWPKAKPGYVYNNNILRLRFTDNVIPDFAFWYMISPFFRQYLAGVKSATTSVAAIYQRSIYAAPFPLPALEVQRETVRLIRTSMEMITAIAREQIGALSLLDNLDRGLLAKAFRGELAPQDPHDEPAEKLLERIRAERAAGSKASGRRGRGRQKRSMEAAA
jgi:type I restriction enzyme S subunit